MSLESRIREILPNFKSVSLFTLAELVESDPDQVENTVCRMIMDEKGAGYRIDDSFVVDLHADDKANPLLNALKKVEIFTSST